jgi:hypothetical protein
MKLKFMVAFIALLVVLTGTLAVSWHVSAHKRVADADNFSPGRLIDNSVMRDTDTMSVSNIQSFLENELSEFGGCKQRHSESSHWMDFGHDYRCLKNYQEDPTENMPECSEKYIREEFGFGSGDSRYEKAQTMCWWKGGRSNFNKDDSNAMNTNDTLGSNGKSAAQLIKDVSDKHNINPQVILVLLQKEQSLVGDSWPWIIQYQSATGFGCPDSSDCDPKYRGFYNQINQAAKFFKEIMEETRGYNIYPPGENDVFYHPDDSCGKSTVDIKNLATSALYNYTPYQPNQAALDNLYGTGNSCSTYGNRNFWRDFTDWFGDPTFPLLFRKTCDDCDKDKVYLAWEDRYYHVVSPSVLQALNLHETPIEDVSPSAVEDKQEGPRLIDIVKFKDNPAPIYQIDNRNLHHFGNLYDADGDRYATGKEMYHAYGHSNPDNVTQYPASLKRLFHNYTSPAKMPLTVSAYGKDPVYFIENGNKRHIPSKDIFLNMRKNIDGNPGCPTFRYQRTRLSGRILEPLDEAKLEENVLAFTDESDGNNYIIENGKRRHINVDGYQTAWGLEDSDFASINAECADSFPRGGRVDSNLVRIDGGTSVYKMKGGDKHRVPSRPAFEAYGYDMGDVINVPRSVSWSMQSTGDINLLAPGNLVRKKGQDAIYAISGEFELKHVPSRAMFNAYGFSFDNVVEVPGFSHFGKTGNIKRWVINPENNNVWLVDKGERHRIHLEEQDNYSWGNRDSIELPVAFNDRVDKGRDLTIYLRGTNNSDPIYRIEQNDKNKDSVKRKYNSSEAFTCDAEWSDVMKVSDAVLDTFGDGRPIDKEDTCN